MIYPKDKKKVNINVDGHMLSFNRKAIPVDAKFEKWPEDLPLPQCPGNKPLWFIKTYHTGEDEKGETLELSEAYCFVGQKSDNNVKEGNSKKNSNKTSKKSNNKKDKKGSNKESEGKELKWIYAPELIESFREKFEMSETTSESSVVDEKDMVIEEGTDNENSDINKEQLELNSSVLPEESGNKNETVDLSKTDEEHTSALTEDMESEVESGAFIEESSENEGAIDKNVNVERVATFRFQITKELQKMGCNDISAKSSDDELLGLLSEQIKKLRSNYDKVRNEKINDNSELNNQLTLAKSAKKSLEENYASLEKEKKELSDQYQKREEELSRIKEIIKQKDDTIEELEKRNEDLNVEKKRFSKSLADQKRLIEELGNSEVGQLYKKIDELNSQLNESASTIESIQRKEQHNEALISKREGEIAGLQREMSEMNAKISAGETLRKDLEAKLKTSEKANNLRAKECEKYRNDIESLTNQINAEKRKFEETKAKLEEAESDIETSLKEIKTLENNIRNLESEKSKLQEEKDVLMVAKNDLSETLGKDLETQIQTYQSVMKDLKDAISSDFLKECDSDAETDTVESMCAKIRKGVDLITNEIDSLKDREYTSVRDLEKSFKEIILNNIESHAFTEIARWWAYSRLPFVLDKAREEGRALEISVIEKAYSALAQLLSLAGYRYQIPILFVQNLKEGEFDNLTGREQLNLDYQVPNVRSHVEKIDREDSENVILDIVSLGYFDGDKLLKKTSVIVQ